MDKNLQDHIADIHQNAFTIDAHFDLTFDMANRRERGEKKVIENNYLPHFKRGKFDLIVSAIFIHDIFLPEMGLRRALDQISYLHDEISESPGLFRICRTMAESRQAKRAGETALFLSLEGADPLQNDLGLLRIFYELGVRGLGLVWSRRNYIADGAFFNPQKEGRKGGLTPFGVELIAKAEELGMFIDVSHINDEGFWDVIDIATQPIIASHSNCRSLANTMRNLTDEQIMAIGQNGGVIGMNSVNLFTKTDKKEVGVADLVDHVDHIVDLVGINHVGLGFDICNSFKNYLQMKEAIPAQDIIKDHSEIDYFTGELITRGYKDEEILAVLGGNFSRVYTEIIG